MKNVKKQVEKGAVIIEGTISLFVFTLCMYALLSVSQIAYAQARVNVALDASTKMIAEYSHVYFVTGLNTYMGNTEGETSKIANSIANSEVTKFLGNLAAKLKGYGIGDVVGTVYETLRAFEGDSLADFIEQKAYETMGKALLEQNLNNSGTKSFKDKYHIVEPGFYLGSSDVFKSKSKDVFMIAEYRIELPVLKFFHLKIPFNMMACSFTQAWGEDLGGR